MKNHKVLIAAIVLIAMLSAAWAQQSQEKGADIIQLNPDGAMAVVTFPHHAHQNQRLL